MYVCIHDVIQVIIMKIKMKNRSYRYNKNKPKYGHGHNDALCIKQHLNNICSSIHEIVKQH